ncbi:MAG: hypothetical protein K2X77_11745 [Candidatus Obscuribacterales bacterium]|nr:hypothetical protein [Candidatus Obscuribacterales bacterium]
MKFQSCHAEEASAYLNALGSFVESSRIGNDLELFGSLMQFWGQTSYACEDLNRAKDALARLCYTYLILSRFLTPDSITKPTKNLPALPEPQRLIFQLLEGLHPMDEYLRVAEFTEIELEATVEDKLTKQIAGRCRILERDLRIFADQLRKELQSVSGIRKQIMHSTLGTHDSYDHILVVIENSFRRDSKIPLSVAQRYSNYLIRMVTEEPQKACRNHRDQILANFYETIQLVASERELMQRLQLRDQGLVSAEFFCIEQFKNAIEVLQDAEGEYLIAKYYSDPICGHYDFNEATLWATSAGLKSFVPAQQKLAELAVMNGDITISSNIYRQVEGNLDANVRYSAACLLLEKGKRKDFNYHLGIVLARKAVAENHPASLCLLAKVTFNDWSNGFEADPEEALELFEKAAQLGFGMAKVELEKFHLIGWKSHPSVGKFLDSDSNVSQEEKDLFLFLSKFDYSRERRKPNPIDPLVGMKKRSKLLTNRFLVGKILCKFDVKLGLPILEDAGANGHPEACRLLSDLWETELKDPKRSLEWQEKYLQNIVHYGDGFHIDEFKRLRKLKESTFASPTRSINE